MNLPLPSISEEIALPQTDSAISVEFTTESELQKNPLDQLNSTDALSTDAESFSDELRTPSSKQSSLSRDTDSVSVEEPLNSEEDLEPKCGVSLAQSIYQKIPFPLGVCTLFLAEPMCKLLDTYVIDPAVEAGTRKLKEIVDDFREDTYGRDSQQTRGREENRIGI